MAKIGWLHLSDFHQGLGDQPWTWPDVKDQVFRDLPRLYNKSGPWDLILFTGDLTQSGEPAQFVALSKMLEELLAEIGKLGSKPAVLAVPGNHDLVRPPAYSAGVLALRAWHELPVLRNAPWNPRITTTSYATLIQDAFNAYSEWNEEFARTHTPPSGVTITRTPGVFPGDFAATVEKERMRLAVVGLNSAFLQLTDEDYQGKLDLDARQLVACCNGDPPKWLKSHHAALLLTHHPISWLHENARKEFHRKIAPPGRFAAHLFGHMHDARAESVSSAGFQAKQTIQASSLFGLETFGTNVEVKRVHGYSAGQLKIEGAAGTIRVWPRAQSPVGPDDIPKLMADNRGFNLDDDDSISMVFQPTIPFRHEEPEEITVVEEGKKVKEDEPPKTNVLWHRYQRPMAAYDANWFCGQAEWREEASSYLTLPGNPLLLWGPKLVGKTWQLKHVSSLRLDHGSNTRLAEVDLRLLRRYKDSFEKYLSMMCRSIASALSLNERAIAADWQADSEPGAQFQKIMRNHILSSGDGLLILAIDRAEEMLSIPDFQADYFAMLRTCADQAHDHQWKKLRLVVTSSTKYLSDGVHASAFDGLSAPIEIEDLGDAEIEDLSKKYDLGWGTNEIEGVEALVGGHPYLLRTAMYTAVRRRAAGKPADIGTLLDPQADTFRRILDWYRKHIDEKSELRKAVDMLKSKRIVPVNDAHPRRPGDVNPRVADGSIEAQDADVLFRLGIAVAELGGCRLRYKLHERL